MPEPRHKRIAVTRRGGYWNVGNRPRPAVVDFLTGVFGDHDLSWLTVQEVYDQTDALREVAAALDLDLVYGERGRRRGHNALLVNPRHYLVTKQLRHLTRKPGQWIGLQGAGRAKRTLPGYHVGAELRDNQIDRSPTVLSGHHQSTPGLPLRRKVWAREMDALARVVDDTKGSLFVCGDFNRTPDHPAMRPLETRMVSDHAALGSLPTFKRTRAIDHAWKRGRLRLVSHTMLDPGPKKGGDLDHALVVVEYVYFGRPV